MKKRTGVFVCHCGINIAYRVLVKELAEYVSTLPNVAISRDYLFMCSDPGQELIENDIRDYSLTRVVVASCSPRMHEKTFRAACQRAGLNPYRAFHMVNVREHVSWVTEDEDESTKKAKTLIGAGILRVAHQYGLTAATFPVCTNTLVVGGGIAEAGDKVFGPLRDAVRSRVTLVPTDQIEIVPATFGRFAGAVGAALAGALRP